MPLRRPIREAFLILVFDKEVERAGLEGRPANKAVHDFGMILQAGIPAVHMSMVRNDHQQRIGQPGYSLFNRFFEPGYHGVCCVAYRSRSVHRGIGFVPVGIDELFSGFVTKLLHAVQDGFHALRIWRQKRHGRIGFAAGFFDFIQNVFIRRVAKSDIVFSGGKGFLQ